MNHRYLRDLWKLTSLLSSLFFGVTLWQSTFSQAQSPEVLINHPLDELVRMNAIPEAIPLGLLKEAGEKSNARVLYYVFLYRSLQRVLPPNELERFFRVLISSDGITKKTRDLEQILRAARVANLEIFLSVYNRTIQREAKISHSRTSSQDGDASIEHPENSSQRLHELKLESWGLVALFHFYDWLAQHTDAERPQFYRGLPYQKQHARVIHLMAKTVKHPRLPYRPHGVNAPEPIFDASKWQNFFKPFDNPDFQTLIPGLQSFKLAFLAALVNYQAGHRASAQISELSNQFFRELHAYYQEAPEERFQEVKSLLLIYLANSSSDALIRKIESGKSLNLRGKTLSEAILKIRNWHQSTLRRFILEGHLPASFSSSETSVLAKAHQWFLDQANGHSNASGSPCSTAHQLATP